MKRFSFEHEIPEVCNLPAAEVLAWWSHRGTPLFPRTITESGAQKH